MSFTIKGSAMEEALKCLICTWLIIEGNDELTDLFSNARERDTGKPLQDLVHKIVKDAVGEDVLALAQN
jgi:hypothetical protein